MSERSFVILYTNQKTKKAKTWHDGTLRFSGNGTRGVLYDDKNCRIDTIHVRSEDILLGEQLESDRHYILIEEESKSGATSQNDTPRDQPAVGPIRSGGNKSKIRTGLKKGRGGFVPPRLIAAKDPEPPKQQIANVNCGEMEGQSPVRKSHHFASFQRRYNILNQVSPRRTLSELNNSEMSGTDPLFLNSRAQNSPDRGSYRENSSPLIGLMNRRSLTTSPWSTIGSSQSPGSSKLDSQQDTDIQELGPKPFTHFIREQIVENTCGLQHTMQENSFTSHQKRSTTQILALLSKTSSKTLITEGNSCNTNLPITKPSPQNRLSSTNELKCSFDKMSPLVQPVDGEKEGQMLQWNQQQGEVPATPGIPNLSNDCDQSHLLSFSSQRSFHNSGSFIADSKNQPDDSHYDLISTPSMVTCMESERTKSLCESPDYQSDGRVEVEPQHIIRSEPEQIIGDPQQVVQSEQQVVQSEPKQVVQSEAQQAVQSEAQHTVVMKPEHNVKDESHLRVHNEPQHNVISEPQFSAVREHPDNVTSNIVDEKDSAISVHEVNNQSELTDVELIQKDVNLSKEESSKQCLNIRMESGDYLEEEGEEDEMDCQGGASFAISFSPLSVIPSDYDSDCEEPPGSGENIQQQEEQEQSVKSAEVSDSLSSETEVKIMVNGKALDETEVNKGDNLVLQEDNQDVEIAEERNTCTSHRDVKDPNSLKEKESTICKTGDGVNHCLDSSQTPCITVNEYREKHVKKEEAKQSGMSQKRVAGQTDSEGFSQKSLGYLELSPDSPGYFFKSSQTNSSWISQNAHLIMNSSDVQVGNVKLPVFETSWSEDESMFDTSPLRLNRHQQQEYKADSESCLNSLKCSEKCDSGDNTLTEDKSHIVECISNEHVEEKNVFINPHFRRYDQFRSNQESDQRWINEKMDSCSVTSMLSSLVDSTEMNCVPKTEPCHSLKGLPHPSELIRSPQKMEEKDLSKKISERMDSYRMRGSVIGMTAKRHRIPTLQQTGFNSKTGPNIILSQVRRGPKGGKTDFKIQSEETVHGDWIDKLQAEQRNTEARI
ncbi:protein ZGRF1-like [Saccostrea echinata]|uniref:protein ZGRF1-like n=1 Tax=Saccostrea echinata TaxID=191078 RepID=UPI002A815C04|nr:protein ZGRF1-like [Saccostrea echinata]